MKEDYATYNYKRYPLYSLCIQYNSSSTTADLGVGASPRGASPVSFSLISQVQFKDHGDRNPVVSNSDSDGKYPL